MNKNVMITIVTFRNWKRKTHCWQDLWWTSYIGELETDKIWRFAIAKGKHVVAVGSSGILKGKQKLGVTFNSVKLGSIDFTKFSKLTICSA